MNEEVTVLLTTYNGEKYLSEQIESIMNQTFRNFVCFVHDDGSKDHTLDILQEKKEKYSEKVVLLNYPRQGCPRDNFLSMLEYVDTPYVMFADQDDYWLPEKVQKTLDMMKEGEKNSAGLAIAVYTDVKMVNEKLDTIADSFYTYTGKNPRSTTISDLIMSNVALGCTMMLNRKLYKKYKKCELATIPNHDWLFMLLAKTSGDVYFIPESLMLYRQHSQNNVGATEGKSVLNKIVNSLGPRRFAERIKGERETINRQRNRAAEILNFILPDNAQVDFLRELKGIGTKRKLQRMRFYMNWHLHTNQNLLLVLIAC